MIYSAAAFAWIGGFVYNVATVFSTTAVIDGACYPYDIWESAAARKISVFWYFVSFYLIILLIFIFCYWRILVVIRRQANVMAGHAAGEPNPAQTQFNQMQSNVIKTMILVSALYAILWLPNYIYFLILTLNPNRPPVGGFYATVIIAYLYMSTNPVIYATKFDPVREVLLRLIPCRKNTG